MRSTASDGGVLSYGAVPLGANRKLARRSTVSGEGGRSRLGPDSFFSERVGSQYRPSPPDQVTLVQAEGRSAIEGRQSRDSLTLRNGSEPEYSR